MNYLLITVYLATGYPQVETRREFPSLEACTQAAVVIKKTQRPALDERALKPIKGSIETRCVHK